MGFKKPMGIALCMALGVALVGCPSNGPLVVGPYKIYFDNECDETDDSVHVLVLYPGGTLEFFSDGVEKTGEWSRDGSTISIVIVDFFGDLDLDGTATIQPTALVDGTYTLEGTVVVEGCFSADKFNI